MATKKRVYEVASLLHSTSDIVRKKLKEIGIPTKSHMSALEDEQVEALFKYVGKKSGSVAASITSGTNSSDQPNTGIDKVSAGDKNKVDKKSGPRIVKRTQRIINTGLDKLVSSGSSLSNKGSTSGQGQNKKPGNSYGVTNVTSNTSGLRPGFIRNNGVDYSKKPIKKDIPSKTGVVVDKKEAEKKEIEKIDKKVASVQDVKKVEEITKKPTSDLTITEEKTNNLVNQSLVNDGIKAIQEKPETVNSTHADLASNPKNKLQKSENKVTTAENKSRNENRLDQSRGQSYNRDRSKTSNSGMSKDHYKKRESSDSKKPQTARNQRQGNKPVGQDNRSGNRTQGSGQYNNKSRFSGSDNRSNSAFRPTEQGARSKRNDALITTNTPVMTQSAHNARNDQRKDNGVRSNNDDKGFKKRPKKEIIKGQLESSERVVPQKLVSTKTDVNKVLSEDFLNDLYTDSTKGKSKFKRDRKSKTENNFNTVQQPKPVMVSVKLPEDLTVKELAERLKKTATEVIKRLMQLGFMTTLNQEVDFDTASIIADEFGIKAEKEIVVSEEDILFDDTDDKEEDLKPRPPVVVVMGHVDHGKTSLLDAIRETEVMKGEAGGITQHIGAYTVRVKERNITFLDTPGHEAFTAMRARGAQVTDIAILVVAADDGVKPQTIEAINHAKAANVAIVVAINKIDKPGANIDKVKQELMEYGLVSEEWGGDIIFVPVSAKKRENIDALLEMVLLTADIMELKANPNSQAKGTVIEARLDKDRGTLATILVQRGTLEVGNSIITGSIVGRIRAMVDDKGHRIKKAGPSTPVEILGLSNVPKAGELFYCITDERVAKQLVEKRKFRHREQTLKASSKVSLDDLFSQIKEGKIKDLNLIIKADVQGSVEAVRQSLLKLSGSEVRVNIVHGGVGAITESDVTLAQVSNAIIIAFNVRPSTNILDMVNNAGVDLRCYRVIYEAINDIEAAMKGMLEPTLKEVVQGHAEVRQIFTASGIGTIAGSRVLDGKIIRNSDARVIRDGLVVFEGKISSLKRFKDDIKEVSQGYECGITLQGFNDIKENDVVESFTMEEVKAN